MKAMTDLIERLRALKTLDVHWERLATEAADEIKRLTEDRLCRCADEVRCELKAEIERLECQLAISRGKHTNAIAEIERLRNGFMELCTALENQLGPGTPTEWVNKIERLREQVVNLQTRNNALYEAIDILKRGGKLK